MPLMRINAGEAIRRHSKVKEKLHEDEHYGWEETTLDDDFYIEERCEVRRI